MIARAVPLPRGVLTARVIDGLNASDGLLAQHLDAVRREFGPSGLGVIDLPQLGSGQLVRAQISVCGALYWCYEVEQAGLLPFIEALAQGVVHGTVVLPLGAVIPELTRFWRSSEHRFQAAEREALFTRIFGVNQSPFEQQIEAVVQALIAIGRAPLNQTITHLEARAAVAAQQLGSTLTQYGVGIAAFAARDIVGQVRTALRLLQHADLVRALGGGSPWQLMARHAPVVLGREVMPDRHLARAAAGMRVIAWIASEAAPIEGGLVHLSRSAPVIREAEAWSAASGAP
jgi:hypothetical protein